MINILFLTSGTNLGGTERMTIHLLRELDRNLFNCYVLSLLPEEGIFLDEVRGLGISAGSLNFKGYNYASAGIKLGIFLRQHRIDIANIFGLTAGVIARPIAKIMGLKVISNIRGLEKHRTALDHILDRITSFFVDIHISNSEAGKQHFLKILGLDAGKIIVIRNGIDLQRYNFSEKANIIFDSQKFNVLVLANLKPDKGHRSVVDAIPSLSELKDKIHFYFLGRDYMQGKLHEYVEQQGCNQYITFLGFNKDVIPYLRSADMVLLPSHHEGLPTSILEAMLCSTFVVATDVGGIPELITHKKEGLLIPSGNANAIADSIRWAINNKAEVAQYVRNAREKAVEQFRLQQMVKHYEEVFQSLVR